MISQKNRLTDFYLFLARLVTPAVLKPYCWLLKHYKQNNEPTNHAIIKMLHRVAVDLKTPAMLFQLSLFCTFQKIISDPAASQYKVSWTLSFIRCIQFGLYCSLGCWKILGVLVQPSELYPPKIEPLIRLNNRGILHLFSKCSDRKSISACIWAERLFHCHFRSEHLKNECIIPAFLNELMVQFSNNHFINVLLGGKLHLVWLSTLPASGKSPWNFFFFPSSPEIFLK